jgi:DNA-binding MarR family transcriptional regulator
MNDPPLTDEDYGRLLGFRDGLRAFLRWSEDQARAAGLTPAQHQLLLAVRGHEGGDPSVGDVADHLLLRHHSAVELVDRAERAGLVVRRADPADQRVVRVHLTALGRRRLESLARANLEELRRLRGRLTGLWAGLPD